MMHGSRNLLSDGVFQEFLAAIAVGKYCSVEIFCRRTEKVNYLLSVYLNFNLHVHRKAALLVCFTLQTQNSKGTSSWPGSV